MQETVSAWRGCLLGLAVGDAMGYTVDKKNWEEICEDYGPNGLLGYDLVNGYADATSYTQLAAFVANGLLVAATRSQPESYPKYLAVAQREWLKSQQYRGGEDKTACWMAQVPQMRRRHCMDTRMLDVLGRETLGTPEKPSNYDDGPAAITTAVGVGVFFDPSRMDPRQIGSLAAAAMAMTHGAPEAILSAAVLAYSIAGILHAPELSLAEQFIQAAEAVQQQFGKEFSQTAAVVARVKAAMDLTTDTQITPREAMEQLRCRTCLDCLAAGIYASCTCAHDFDAGMILSVNHSGRSAAVGAITGAILGARLGAEALPDFYLESLEAAPILDQLAQDLALGRQTTRIFDDSWDQKYVHGLPVL